MGTLPIWAEILLPIILAILVAMSALFSFSEMAISSSNKARLKSIASASSTSERKKKQANRVIFFVENYNEHISAIVIFNNIVNVLFSTLATAFFSAIIQEPYGPLVSFLVTTPIVIIFGEIVPKQLAKKYPESGTMRLSFSLKIVAGIMKPITFILSKIIKEEEQAMLGSDQEIELALQEATRQGVTSSFEEHLINKSLEIDNKTLKDVMLPIEEVEVLKLPLTIDKINKLITKTPHSRFPVLNRKGGVDSIFSAKRYLTDNMQGNVQGLEEYQYEYATLSEDDNPFHAFELLRNRREKMAIIVDEEESVIGVITMEDIIELMLGNIYDEDDLEEDGVYTLSETSYIVWPNVKVSYLKENYIKDLRVDEAKAKLTVGKLVELIAGKKVKPGEHYTFKNLIIWVNTDNVEDEKIIFEIDIV